MKRAPSKKGLERRPDRRKTPRSSARRKQAVPANAAQAKAASKSRHAKTLESVSSSAGGVINIPAAPISGATSAGTAVLSEESCQHCTKVLMSDERALFVEEEVGRIFCSEACIAAFFAPEIERLEKDYHRKVSGSDLSKDERDSYSHLRWITLQEPDEIWREKTLSGDHRYTLMSEFQPGSKRIWSICICLFLKGEPSFLYLAFTTKNAALVNSYRKGERVEWAKGASGEKVTEEQMLSQEQRSDRLADSWTEDETFLAQVNQERRADDISPEDFPLFEKCIEETLETPDEVWNCQPSEQAARLYHFIRYYPAGAPGIPEIEAADDFGVEDGTGPVSGLGSGNEESSGIWYIVIAREAEEEEQIEILDAFPTRDSALVDRYRRGDQEVGHTAPGPQSRIVH
jgi:hypothetical protein